MEMICIVLGIVCLGYYGVMLSIGMDFSFIWLAAGLVFTVGGGAHRYLRLHGRVLPFGLRAAVIGIVIVGIAVFLFLEGLICTHMFDKGEESLDYVIVLGAQVRGDVPSRALRRRIDKAEEYLRANPDTIAVLSGGKGAGENRSEAQVMYDCLVEAGISGERLIMEDQSTSTVENLEFSAAYTGKDARIGLISQNFHIYRALRLGKKQGYEQLCGIAASSELLYQPHYLVREAFAIVKELLTGNMSLW